jgi:hypothetical protein
MNLPDRNQNLSVILITLMKGVMHVEADPPLWQQLLNLQSRVRDFLSTLGLELMLDEAEGYAFLKQRSAREGEMELPRLIPRRQLSYPVSLLLALLRKKLAEFDARSGETRFILGRDEIVDLVRNYFADTANSARLQDRILVHIKKVVDMGFLRLLRGSEDQFEVGRILKAYVDAQWLQEFASRLEEYRTLASGEATHEEGVNP